MPNVVRRLCKVSESLLVPTQTTVPNEIKGTLERTSPMLKCWGLYEDPREDSTGVHLDGALVVRVIELKHQPLPHKLAENR